MQKVPSEVLSFAKAQGFDFATYIMEWKGFSVYALSHDTGDGPFYAGYPVYALVDSNGGIRKALDEEKMAILRS